MKLKILILTLALLFPLSASAITKKPIAGSPTFLFPKIYQTNYFYSPAPQFGHTVWFAGNRLTKGTLYLSRTSVPIRLDQYGVPYPTHNSGNLNNYTYRMTDRGGVSVHYFNIDHIGVGEWYARGCVESNFGLSCGKEFMFNK